MTASAPAVADLLWGSGQGLAAALAQYPVPAAVLAAARNNQLTGNVWDVSGLDTYIGQGNGVFNGYPVLNSQPLGTEISVWDASGCDISLNSSPPAGAPITPTILLVPSGSSQSPQAYSGSAQVFSGGTIYYAVSSFMYPVSAADSLNVGIDWYDGSTAAGGVYIKTTSASQAITAGAWNSVTESFTPPAGAHIGFPWAGLFNESGDVNAGHTVNIAGIYCTTPYS